jgi:hypothetical protein
MKEINHQTYYLQYVHGIDALKGFCKLWIHIFGRDTVVDGGLLFSFGLYESVIGVPEVLPGFS